MQEKHLHIISFDVPFPADYGGVIDVFHKVKALHKKGIKIHRHIFQYGREQADILESFCEEVNYYPRKTGIMYNLSSTPYIILSRICGKLIHKIKSDNYPILCEGMHTCGMIQSPILENRKFIYRSSNVEHHYYNGLANNEKNIFKRYYYRNEAKKLLNWEFHLKKAELFLTVSKDEQDYYKEVFPDNKVENIYSFFEQDNISFSSEKSKDKYILFHGKLSVQENITTANYIIKEIAPNSAYKFIIAGMNPDRSIYSNAKQIDNIKIIANPDDAEMKAIISEAHINLLLTDQATGLKLKLLNSLYQGKFCVVNNNMLAGTDLSKCVEIANTKEEILKKIKELMQEEFTIDTYNKRKALIPHEFDNEDKADRLIELIFN